MYLSLIPKIKELLEGVVIQEVEGGDDKMLNVIPYPLEKGEYPKIYPTVVFYPNDYTNEFASNETNFKVLKFRALLMINAENISNDDLFTFTLPNTADKIIEKIDKEWDVGTLNGKRTWIKTDVGFWGLEQSDKGKIAFMEMDLITKFETDN